MNYFTFSEIAKGVFALFFSGFLAALIVESVKLLWLCKDAFLSLPINLYKNRKHFLGCAFACPGPSMNLTDAVVLDFLSVIILFALYILTSYLYFDGIFRLIHLIPLLALYFISKKHLLKPYFYISALGVCFSFRIINRWIAPIVFILNKTICVLKLPLAAIIFSFRLMFLRFLSTPRMRSTTKYMQKSCEKMLAICAESSIELS